MSEIVRLFKSGLSRKQVAARTGKTLDEIDAALRLHLRRWLPAEHS